jgi:type IV pilus assembly protein PilW
MMICRHRQAGLTLVELMVALAIGSFLVIGAVQIYNQSRQAFIVNEAIAQIQETAQFAMDTIEADLRLASHWGLISRASAVEGRSLVDTTNPNGLPEPLGCGSGWALDLMLSADGQNNAYTLPCAGAGGGQANSDVLTVRRSSVSPTVPETGRLQIQSTRVRSQVFADGVVPEGFSPVDSETHDLLVNSYYVAADSAFVPGVPTLRRKSLGTAAGTPAIIDQEVAPGVENLQVQFGIDVDGDNAVERYVNPGDPIYDPSAPEFVPGARVLTARVWLVVRSISAEVGIQDDRDYKPGDVDLGAPDDEFRRMLVSKTILLRNVRT